MIRIATCSISAYMIQLRNVFTFSSGKFFYFPGIENTMCRFKFMVIYDMPITAEVFSSYPIPASGFNINRNLIHKTRNLNWSRFYNKIIDGIHKSNYTINEPGTHNLTQSRWRQDQFCSQRNCRGWTEADEVPGWGVTKDRFREILENIR
jgi:hypothetical protein